MSQQQTGVPSKTTGEQLTASEFNDVNDSVNANAEDANIRLAPGISIAQLSTPLAQSVGVTYEQITLTDTLLFESPVGVIETSYPLGFDSVKLVQGGLVKFDAILYVEGSNNVELYLKAYKNGVAISAGDPVGINLQGPNKLVALPFSGFLPTAPNDVITYYGRLESAGTFTIDSCNLSWEQTNYI
jgi:hypothetical protein